MCNIKNDNDTLNTHEIELMSSKRIVFITDEAHRSIFGNMLIDIKASIPSALFLEFTGTSIHDENQKNQHYRNYIGR